VGFRINLRRCVLTRHQFVTSALAGVSATYDNHDAAIPHTEVLAVADPLTHTFSPKSAAALSIQLR
jgi:hypothetical protein